MIAEATPCGIGTHYGDYALQRWYEPFFKFIDTHNIKAVSYINSDWESLPMWKGQGWKDSRVQANPAIKERWLKEVGSARYLKCRDDLYTMLDFSAQREKYIKEKR
jgi:hypothetical protein